MKKFLMFNQWTIAIDQIAAFGAVEEMRVSGSFVNPAHIVFHLKTGISLIVHAPRPHDAAAAINELLKDPEH